MFGQEMDNIDCLLPGNRTADSKQFLVAFDIRLPASSHLVSGFCFFMLVFGVRSRLFGSNYQLPTTNDQRLNEEVGRFMLIFPAIDLRKGKCVRLLQGQASKETVYDEDPVAVALRWEQERAQWLHLVDLDGAFVGESQQLPVVREIVKSVGIPVQLGGGIRTLQQIREALNAGVERVILGTVAVSNPELVQQACAAFGWERVVVGIDARDGYVAVKGWQDLSSKHFLEVAGQMQDLGCRRIVFTDTSKDGMLTGPNIQSTAELAEETGMQVIASGGVASLDDGFFFFLLQHL